MYDLVVLGGGPGGLSVAKSAARVGAKVALIEKHRLGGECTHHACVPSKALIRAARIAHEVRRAGEFGIHVGAPGVNFAEVMGRVRSVVASFAGSGSGDGLRAQGIDVYHGSPAFEAYDSVVIDGTSRVEGRRFVIATGSTAAVPSVPGLGEAGFLDNVSIWDLQELPRSLLIIGAGPVGLEFGQAFARLGTQVTILADSPHILPREDPEIADRVQALLMAEGIVFHANMEVTGVEVRDGKKVCKFHGKSNGATFEASRDEILIATGRRANVLGLNLDAVGVHADPEHGIEVDEYLQTRTRNIYAIGDVLGHHEWTHAAEREAAVVFQNAVLRIPRRIDYSAIPWTTFTDPEIASVGVLAEADDQHDPASTRIVSAAYADLDRARIDGRTSGFAKVRATNSGKILGVTILGAEASAVLQEFVLAMEHGLTLNDIARTVHPFPTYAGLAGKLADQFAATRMERGFLQTALRWFHGFQPRAERADETNGQGAAQPVSHVEAHGR